MKFAVFSDVHIGGKFSEEMFKKGVDILNKLKADFTIFTGDLTDQATLADFELATETYLPMLEIPILMIPGNHDVKNSGFLLWEEYIGPRFFIESNSEKKVKILGLDSNEPDKNTGRIGEKGIDRIYDEFQELDEDWLKILTFHHQTLPIKYTGRERSAINDAGDVIKAIMDCNLDLVLNGHRHISNVYTLSDGDTKSLIVNCGTMSCKKTRYKEEYSITTVDIDKLKQKAKVNILLLNRNDGWVPRFDGKLIDPPFDYSKLNLNEKIATFIQIGNTEFSDTTFNLESYTNGIKLINSLHDCDLVIHNGDVTNDSYLEEFEEAKTMLSIIEKPLLVVPGPRDYFPLGSELYKEFIGLKNPNYENPKFKILGFNTCVLDDKIGNLGRSRMSQIYEELVNPDQLGVVAFHHNIVPIPRTRHESELQDAGDVLAMIVENHIDLVLTGAKNKAGCWQVNDTVFVNAGTISSRNIMTKKGNSINKIEIYKTKIGKFYKIDEIFVNTGEIRPLGRMHIPFQHDL